MHDRGADEEAQIGRQAAWVAQVDRNEETWVACCRGATGPQRETGETDWLGPKCFLQISHAE